MLTVFMEACRAGNRPTPNQLTGHSAFRKSKLTRLSSTGGWVSVVVPVAQHNNGGDVMGVQLRHDGCRFHRWNTDAGTPTVVTPARRVGENIIEARPLCG